MSMTYNKNNNNNNNKNLDDLKTFYIPKAVGPSCSRQNIVGSSANMALNGMTRISTIAYKPGNAT
jgi:hypothetical protein